jgi:hypothetical protein
MKCLELLLDDSTADYPSKGHSPNSERETRRSPYQEGILLHSISRGQFMLILQIINGAALSTINPATLKNPESLAEYEAIGVQLRKEVGSGI